MRFTQAFIATLAGALLLLAVPEASADADVEAFAKRTIDGGMAILREGGARAERRRKFHAFIIPLVDARKTGLFALGVYRRGAAASTLDAFVDAFKEYSTAIYETRLDNYKDATLTVSGSRENAPGDHVVNTLATSPKLREPVVIAFRVVGAAGDFKIIDVQVAGIWLSIELRDEFAALLSANGGSIEKLKTELERRTRSMLNDADAAALGDAPGGYSFGAPAVALLTREWVR